MSPTELREALANGRREQAAGNLAAAGEWFARAERIAPANPTVALALAGVLLARGAAGCVALYRGVAEGSDVREGWLGLAVASLRHGSVAEAARALATCLSRHAMREDVVAPVATAIAEAAGAPGWCAFDGAGTAIAWLRTDGPGPALTLDGRTLTPHRGDGGRWHARLPRGWERARTITAAARTAKGAGAELLGSPIAASRIMRVEGFVDTADGDLHGWAWCPNDAERHVVLSLIPARGAPLSVAADDESVEVGSPRPFAVPRGFRVPAGRLSGLTGPVRVCGPDGRELTGSPLDPTAERVSAERAATMIARLFPAPGQPAAAPGEGLPLPGIPAASMGAPPRHRAVVPGRRKVDVIVPVYNGLTHTLACLDAVLADLPAWARVVIVDDASPDPRMAEALARLARPGRVIVRTAPANRGFPATANSGMRHDAARDVVLLNSDTLVPPGWLARLREAACAAPDIGSATPFSNDATILSYPATEWPNPIPDLAATVAADRLARQANDRVVVDIPTAVGFCMYIRRDCLNAVGLFREDVFGQGYGEENDFCIRARHLGWRHVAVPGVFVAHVGGQSFGTAKQHLIGRNLRVLNRLHPGYDALVRTFIRADPLAEARRRLDALRWANLRDGREAVLLVTHGRGGGVQRRLAERARALRAEGRRPIVLRPAGRREGEGRDCVLDDRPEGGPQGGIGGGTPNLRFHIPEELDELAALLRHDRPVRAEVHHLVGHDHALFDLFRRLAIPYDMVIHDYSWLCPRINLVGAGGRYCGEPDLAHCDACTADFGAANEETIGAGPLRARSAAELAGAERVIVPSHDVAARLRRYFPTLATEVTPWEDDTLLPPASPAPMVGGEVRVCVIGAIGAEKGYDILLACARDAAARALPLRFRLVGYSSDDRRLLQTGRIDITGPYEEHAASELIRAQRAQLAWLASMWPETWCYTLTEGWRAGLDTVAFDLGAPAERIRATGRGWLLPLGAPPSAINAQLLRLGASRAGEAPAASAAVPTPVYPQTVRRV